MQIANSGCYLFEKTEDSAVTIEDGVTVALHELIERTFFTKLSNDIESLGCFEIIFVFKNILVFN